jgi:glycosidase
MTGEVWWEDWNANKMYDAAPWLQGDAFDAVMNYRLARDVYHYFIDKADKIAVSEFDRRLTALRADYPDGVNYVLMNLLDSHDTDRLTSHIVNPDLLYDHKVGLSDNKNYDPRKPGQDEQKIQKLMVLFQMCYLGAPMVYYGDEVGMWGGDDPDDRKPMLWADLKYEDESSMPFGGDRAKDSNVADMNLFEYYKNLIHIRKSHEALMTGDISTVLADDAGDVYAFKRSTSNESVIVVMNNARTSQVVSFPAAGEWKDALTGTAFNSENGKLSASVGAKSGLILCNSGH